jgi:hypothetical protein
MASNGQVLGFGANQGTVAIVNAAFSGLDRTSLFSIASNSGGQFTQVEQEVAQSQMSTQQGHAMGLYDVGHALTADPAADFLAGINFLNSVSPEEKASANWQVSYASALVSYQNAMSQSSSSTNDQNTKSSTSAQNINTGNPVVDLIANTI